MPVDNDNRRESDRMVFNDELEFEDALVDVLLNCGWNDPGGVLMHPSEQDLIDNWASILFENNKDIDRLNGCPLTQGEMQQIIEQINALRTPVALNGFINGKTVPVTRDNPDDTLHFGKEVSLKIYDRDEIAGGQSRYQIARQPHYAAKAPLLNSRRGDVVLLINGMPVIHIELKRSGVQVSQAEQQIKNYLHEGVFTGLFSLVQIFVAMNPEEAHYFANPGSANALNPNFFFHWADFNNEPVNGWKNVATQLLSIPMAHQLIGFYTVADSADGVLKVMRSYQYFAASRISDRVFTINRKRAWGAKGTRGGYIWHTTGSGKTMTSFKSAQLIANSKDADKVVFLVDRIELGTQSLGEYRGFADDADNVQETESTEALKAKLKSDDPANALIVTSIQKMSNIKEEGGMNARDLEKMRSKRIVFIVDECHRSTFGDMLIDIKASFPDAVFFGFTGTPIHKENQKKNSTTASVFGDELHRYSIADGIRDKNVLGFDPYMVLTFPDKDVRRAVALGEAKAESVDEVIADPAKSKVYYYFMDISKVPMAGDDDAERGRCKGIEDFLPETQYGTPANPDATPHQVEVVQDIKENWLSLSRGKFHAIFATHSIAEAIQYYRLLKERAPDIKIAGLFDPAIDNNEGAIFKEEGLVELLSDYNNRYGKEFALPTFAAYKKDVAARLAHKRPYVGIENTPEECLDLLVVVDQMLTGFDSKWVNTLYLDKVLHYEGIIQAFSRTNRLFGDDKPFGVIRYYRRPHTMKREIEKAVKLYSGDKPFGLFVDKLPENIAGMNRCFDDIRSVFQSSGADGFERLPQDDAAKGKFASLFKQLNEYLEAARVQGFTWDRDVYDCKEEDSEDVQVTTLAFNETVYLTLALRYKELFSGETGPGGKPLDAPFDIDARLIEIDTGVIDTEYMNSNFDKWLKELARDGSNAEAIDQAMEELHRSFAMLSQDEQRCAELFIHDVQCGDVQVEEGKTFRDYVTDYQQRAKNQQVMRVVEALGVDEGKLSALMALKVTPANINEFDRFDDVLQTLDAERARAFFEAKEGAPVPKFKVRARADALLRSFILEGGFDID